LHELLGHYVNYRKQVSPSMQELLPEEDFRLIAVSVRYPQGLAQGTPLRQLRDGVYEVNHYTGTLRLIVVHQLAEQEQNALMHLFSARREQIHYGQEHYRLRSEESTTLLRELFTRYREEGVIMADVYEQFVREARDRFLRELTVEQRLQGLSPEELRKRLTLKERLEGLSPDDVLRSLPPETRAALLQRLKEEESTSTPE